MLKIGVTGGIGSGKSLVCQVFAKLGIPVFYSDIEARIVSTYDPLVVEGLAKIFDDSFFEFGMLNREKMATAMFEDTTLLKKVNALIHPKVRERFLKWAAASSTMPYIINEGAVMFESGADGYLDKVIVIYSPEELRFSRTLERKTMPRGTIERIMRQQMPEEEKMNRADFVIVNDEKEALIPQILSIHEKLFSEITEASEKGE